MVATADRHELQPVRSDVKRETENILDRLQVDERSYHHLDFTKPLVIELATRLRLAHSPPARVLLIGSDSLLAQLLVRLGYEIDLWHFRQGLLTDDLMAHVRAVVTPQQLESADLPLSNQPYDAIIAPLILESLAGNPERFLTRLRHALLPHGSLILATTNVSRLDLRLRALLGQSTAGAYPASQLSLSFPPLPRLRQRYFHRDELLALAREAGFQARECAFIIAQAACSSIVPLPPIRYALLEAGQCLMDALPSTRHAILLHLSPRVGDQGPLARDDAGYSRISVVLAAQDDGAALRQALTALVEQDYPADRFEIIVLHDGRVVERGTIIRELSASAPVSVRELVIEQPEAPAAQNAALQAATGDICAHTDDACEIPPGWVRAIGAAFDDTIGALTGPVIEILGSHPDFMVLPGSRLGWEPHELYPIFNVAYRRQPAIACGAFDIAANQRNPPPFAWDTELAWRLRRMGWQVKYLKDVFLYRRYAPPGRREWIKSEFQLAADLPRAVTRVPELGSYYLKGGGFAGTRTLLFDLLVLGLGAALIRRRWTYLLLALPCLAHYGKFVDIWPVTRWRWSARIIAAIGARHLVWLGGLISGSIKARRVVL